MSHVLEINNLYFAYDKNIILNDINLKVEKGDFLVIVGPNGSGKSTLVKIILGLLRQKRGNVKLFGQENSRFKEWKRIGYVSQKATAFNTSFPATVEEVIYANLYPQVGLFKPLSRELKLKALEALDFVGLGNCSKKLIGSLSGGQQQRVFIARVLVNSPELLILDEPTVGVDEKSRDSLIELFTRLNKEMGITIIMITHNIGPILDKANKVACIDNKKIIVHDPEEYKKTEGFRVIPTYHRH